LTIVHIENQLNLGRAASANVGLLAASGEWIAILDDDDCYIPDGLSSLWRRVRDEGVTAGYGDVEVRTVSAAGEESLVRTMGRPFSRQLLLIQNYIPFNAVIFQRSLLSRTGLICESLKVFEDWEFLARLSGQALLYYIPDVVAHYRSFGSSTITGERFAADDMAAVEALLHASWWDQVTPLAFREFRAYLNETHPPGGDGHHHVGKRSIWSRLLGQ
jgi:glycosyltransferase involved in cell wall biosynthesis